MFRKLFAWIQRYERHLSALAMISGAVIDQFFFGRVDLALTQEVFASYALVGCVTILAYHYIEARRERGRTVPRWRAILPIATGFSLGGFWSGFIVFYGRSAVVSASWPFLLLIGFFFIGNEVFKKYHSRVVFTSVLYFFALYSYAIFALPVFTHTMGDRTFIESGLIAALAFMLFTVLLRLLGRERYLRDVWRIRMGALAVAILLNIFYFTNVLPPLPLSAKAAGVYHDVWRVSGAYMAEAESYPWYDRYLGIAPVLHLAPGESAYAYSSVFAPTALTTTIVHRWQWYDPSAHAWVTRFSLAYPITGGADGGYSGYTASAVAVSGKWRVNVETADGLLIARIPFTVVRTASSTQLSTISL